MSKTETLSIDLLRLDGDTQARIEVHSDTVDEYAELITLSKTKWPFPPLTVYHDGTSYFPADGFHRVLAAVKAGRASIPCDVKKGTARDARFFGMKANDQHGLRMSREDRRKNVVWMLDNYAEMTQANIAENAGVSLRTVGLIVADRKPKNAQIAHSLASKPKPEPAAPTRESLEFTEDLDADGDPVWLTPVEDDDDDTPEPPKVTPEKPPVTQADQAKLNRQLAQSLIDKAVRAVDDLNFVKPDHAKREAAVKLLQGVKLW